MVREWYAEKLSRRTVLIMSAALASLTPQTDEQFVKETLFRDTLGRPVANQAEFLKHLGSLKITGRETKLAEFMACSERTRRIAEVNAQSSQQRQRAAILLCGHFRDFSAPHIQERYHRILERYGDRLDIFIHTWSDSGKRGVNAFTDSREWIDLTSTEIPDFSSIMRMLKPKKIMIENNAEMIELFNMVPEQPGSKNKFLNSQLYGIYMAHDLLKRYVAESSTSYSAIIKIRADKPPVTFNLDAIIRNAAVPDAIYTDAATQAPRYYGCLTCDREFAAGTGREHVEHTEHVGDYYIYGAESAMARYASIYLHRYRIKEDIEIFNSKLVPCTCAEKCGNVDKVVKHSGCREYCNRRYYPEAIIQFFMRGEWILSDRDNIRGW
jgi:hypothetical protein